jgi:3-oxoacyl-[acyl-carrier-protein] synthase II
MAAPNFSINLVASPLSERHGLRAFNVTLTSPVVAGLEAILLGVRAIRTGRADLVVAGATEDLPAAPVGELVGRLTHGGGACAVVLESEAAAGRRCASERSRVLTGTLRFFPAEAAEGQEGAQRLLSLLRQELDQVLPDTPPSLHLCSQSWPFAFNRLVDGLVLQLLRERGVEVSRHWF